MEELNLTYTVHKIDITNNEQKEDWFLKINREPNPNGLCKENPIKEQSHPNPLLTAKANGRIPALVDKTSGTPKRVFEGGSMMLYLCAKYDAQHSVSFAYDTPEYWEMVEWIVWMQSGIGPMQGQANHFYR